jgi:hypothetical protein
MSQLPPSTALAQHFYGEADAVVPEYCSTTMMIPHPAQATAAEQLQDDG